LLQLAENRSNSLLFHGTKDTVKFTQPTLDPEMQYVYSTGSGSSQLGREFVGVLFQGAYVNLGMN
jgi:hypothetical protein